MEESWGCYGGAGDFTALLEVVLGFNAFGSSLEDGDLMVGEEENSGEERL